MTTSGTVPNGFQPPGEIRFVDFRSVISQFCLLHFRTYKRGRLNNAHTFSAGERHETTDEKRTFHLGLNM